RQAHRLRPVALVVLACSHFLIRLFPNEGEHGLLTLLEKDGSVLIIRAVRLGRTKSAEMPPDRADGRGRTIWIGQFQLRNDWTRFACNGGKGRAALASAAIDLKDAILIRSPATSSARSVYINAPAPDVGREADPINLEALIVDNCDFVQSHKPVAIWKD